MRRFAPLPIACLLLVACSTNVERRVVSAAAAPLLGEAKGDTRPMAILRPGDAVEVRRTAGTLEWHGTLDGKDQTRSGELLEVRRADGEQTALLFASDLGGEVKVPDASVICQRLGQGKECDGRLRRVVVDPGVTIGYDPCPTGPCGIALYRGDRFSKVDVDGLLDLHLGTLSGERVVLAETRWTRAQNWSGATLVVFRLPDRDDERNGDRLDRAVEIVTEELDARHPPAIRRSGELQWDATGVSFLGLKRLVAPSTGAILYADPIRERYQLAPRR